MKVNEAKAMIIACHFGDTAQKVKTAEELSELQTILLQDVHDPDKNSRAELLEEVADVYIMLKQLETIYGFSASDVDPIIEYKLDRTLTRIDNEHKDRA